MKRSFFAMSNFQNKCFGTSDMPILSGAEDSFCTEAYIDGLCGYIRSCETPMTISIQGGGGSGRTSMLKMMSEKLLEPSGKEKITVIGINAWQSSQFNVGLTFSVVSLLIKELNEGGAHFRNVMNLFSSIAEKPRKAEEACAVADEIRELKNEFQAAVDQKLSDTGCDRIAFFIDDLDRLQPAKAVDLLEYLKMFIDCEKCVFVLAVNSETIKEGVRQKYGVDEGGDFFDKMIQLPFNVPVEKYDIDKFVRTEFDSWDENILKKNDINLFKSLIGNSIGFNPRGMKRLFNTFRLLDATIDIETENAEKAAIERGEKKTSTEPEISKISRQRALFAVICLQTSFQKLYWFLLSSSSLLDANSLTVFMNDEELRSNAEIMNVVFTDGEGKTDNDMIRRVRKFIPHFQRAIRAGYYDNVSDDEILRTIIREATVTSIGNMIVSNDEDKQDENRKLVEVINAELKSHYKNSVYFQPYYQSGTTEACGYSAFKAYAGFEFSVVYSIRHTIKNTRVVKFMVKNLTKPVNGAAVDEDLWKYCKNEVMFDTLGTDPLNLGRKAECSFSGKKLSMDYDYVGEFAVRDSDGIMKTIIDVMEKAIETVKVHEQPTVLN